MNMQYAQMVFAHEATHRDHVQRIRTHFDSPSRSTAVDCPSRTPTPAA